MPEPLPIRVLTWNLFHGQDGAGLGPTPSSVLRRRAVEDGVHVHLNRRWIDEMAAVIAERRPTIAALQEVPPLAVARLAERTGMAAAHALMPPLLGTTRFRGRLAERNPDLWRTHEGTANVLLVAHPWTLDPAAVWTVRHNPPSVVVRGARATRPGLRETAHWLLEPRRLVAARLRHPSGSRLTAASLHLHNSLRQEVIAVEARRVVPRILDRVPADEPVVVAGDLNAAGHAHPAIRAFLAAGLAEPGIDDLWLDHVFHRGLRVVAPPRPLGRSAREVAMTRPEGERRVLLSDHDPVEADFLLDAPGGVE